MGSTLARAADVAASKYARTSGQPSYRDFTGTEQAIRSMRKGVEKAKEYQAEIIRLREQIEKQRRWLDDPAVPADDLWDQRKEIHDARWQMLEQDIGNLVGWVAVHLAQAERMDQRAREACASLVQQLYEIERWIEDEDLEHCTQYPNGDPIPF